MSVICLYPQQLRAADRLSVAKVSPHRALQPGPRILADFEKAFHSIAEFVRVVAAVFISNRVGPERLPAGSTDADPVTEGLRLFKEDLAPIQDPVKRA
jgi:hypothetical protein